MKKSTFIVAAFAFALIWVLKPNDALFSRAPAQADEPAIRLTPPKIDLLAAVVEFKKLVVSGKLTEKNCAATLDEASRKVFDPAPGALSAETLKITALPIQQAAFDTLLVLRARLKQFSPALERNEGCVRAFRGVFRHLRFLSEMVGEHGLGFPADDAEEQPEVLEGGVPYMYVNPAYDHFELKSGDILLSRGSAFVSTAIARAAGADSNSSHLEIVYIDPVSGKKWTVGAHVEIGALARPLDDYLGVEKVRLTVFRLKDSALAARAAAKIFRRVNDYVAENDENIPYDFKMDMNDSEDLFSSELVASAFSDASAGALKLPAIRSRLNMKNRDFLDRIGVKVESTFMPSDLELDPRFDLVAEWRDFGIVHRSHLKDAVLTAIYDWMERENYVLKETSVIDLKKIATWHLRRWPVFSTFLKSTLPENMSQEMIGVVEAMSQTSEVLFDRLEVASAARRELTGFWLTPTEMLETLEAFRREDLKTYQVYQKTSGYDPLAKKPEFHLLFRPR